jgi:hypothetical protein
MRQAEPVDFPPSEAPPPPPKQIDSREHFLSIMNQYMADNKIPPSLADTAAKTVEWVQNTPTSHTDDKAKEWWAKALANLKAIEETIPKEMGRIEHKLY